MDFFLAVLILLASLAYVFYPLFGQQKSVQAITEKERIREGLLFDKEAIYQQILELDFDRELGNIEEDDYNRSRDDLKKQAARVITALSSSAGENGIKKAGKALLCINCQENLAPDDKFCPYCGQKQK